MRDGRISVGRSGLGGEVAHERLVVGQQPLGRGEGRIGGRLGRCDIAAHSAQGALGLRSGARQLQRSVGGVLGKRRSVLVHGAPRLREQFLRLPDGLQQMWHIVLKPRQSIVGASDGRPRVVHVADESFQGRAGFAHGLLGAANAGGEAALGGVGFRLRLGSHLLGRFHHLLRHRLHEVLVDGRLDGVGRRVGHLGRDGGGLLVHVVVDGRLGEVAGEHAGEVFAEILRDDECRPVASLVDAVYGRLGVGEFPAHLVVVVQLGHHLCAHVQMPRLRAVGPRILVGHGHQHIGRVAVGVPVGCYHVPGVSRRHNDHAQGDDERDRVAQHPFHIPRENGEDHSQICPHPLQHMRPLAPFSARLLTLLVMRKVSHIKFSAPRTAGDCRYAETGAASDDKVTRSGRRLSPPNFVLALRQGAKPHRSGCPRCPFVAVLWLELRCRCFTLRASNEAPKKAPRDAGRRAGGCAACEPEGKEALRGRSQH